MNNGAIEKYKRSRLSMFLCWPEASPEDELSFFLHHPPTHAHPRASRFKVSAQPSFKLQPQLAE